MTNSKEMTRPRRNPEQTRQALLDAAQTEIYRKGFRAASLEEILEAAGVTKGALYYHFQNKSELGYAVVDELIGPQTIRTWIEPLRKTKDPIGGLIDLILYYGQRVSTVRCELGCPLNNLAQEMSPIDEQFRLRLSLVFDDWRTQLAALLTQGQKNGYVADSVDAKQAAVFVVAVIEGISGLAKSSRDRQIYSKVGPELVHYLNSLRPANRNR